MKRVLDVVLAGALLIVASPITLLVALAIRILDGPPILFVQPRTGRHGIPFTFHKFRTMRPGLSNASDEDRLTSLGRLLRLTSLDELPQLWNVLRGDMSLVGPRPLLPRYLDRYTVAQARRHDVRPGITGLAQVSGRNALTWERRFELDIWYVDHQSLGLDLWILCRTVWSVLCSEGIAAKGHATMPEFLGSRPSRSTGAIESRSPR
jgi:lipopolysaccharide/colanic/teichoic acid biosynthesis glycosyltransferase